LHALPIEACPFDERVSIRLARAQADIATGQIDPGRFDERNLGQSPIRLFNHLLATVPNSEDLVVVHGDATFTNILVNSDGKVGFVDCGHCGKADRYTDLAVVVSDIDDRFGQEWIEPFFRAYGLGFDQWDRSKVRFFSDLYELF
jgi:aminoglycoside 3'-phosphotransferase-2